MDRPYEITTTRHQKNDEGRAMVIPPGPEWTQINLVDKGKFVEAIWRKEEGPQVLTEG